MKFIGLPLLAISLGLFGCVSGPKPVPEQTSPDAAPIADVPPVAVIKALNNTRWVAIEIAGESIFPATDGWAAPSLEFNQDGLGVTGHGGVNRFAGRCTLEAKQLSFGPLAMTRRAGPSAQMQLEARYTGALTRVAGWRQDGSHVVLVDDHGAALVVLERAPGQGS